MESSQEAPKRGNTTLKDELLLKPPDKTPVMPEILAENLSGKAIMGSDGAELGMDRKSVV